MGDLGDSTLWVRGGRADEPLGEMGGRICPLPRSEIIRVEDLEGAGDRRVQKLAARREEALIRNLTDAVVREIQSFVHHMQWPWAPLLDSGRGLWPSAPRRLEQGESN